MIAAGADDTLSPRRRYSKGLLMEQPQPFVNATSEQLVQHLEDEHPAAWAKTQFPSSTPA